MESIQISKPKPKDFLEKIKERENKMRGRDKL
jgi:hypothetical protein